MDKRAQPTANDVEYTRSNKRENVDWFWFLCELIELLGEYDALLVEDFHEILEDGEVEGRGEHLTTMEPLLTGA